MAKIEMTYGSMYPDGTSKEIKESINQEDLYKRVVELMREEVFDNGIVFISVATSDGGVLKYSIRKRNKATCVSELSNTLDSSYDDNVRETYLTCTDKGTDAYKFVKMIPVVGRNAVTAWDNLPIDKQSAMEEWGVKRGQTLLRVSYGCMGVEDTSVWHERSYYYPPRRFLTMYLEEISKGYTDRSEAYFAEKPSEQKNAGNVTIQKKDGPSSRLFDQLRSFSADSVKQAKVQVPITVKIIELSKMYLQAMREAKTVEGFNEQLIELISTLQRPVPRGSGSGVANMLASSKADFARIIQREEDLIQSMEGSIDGVITVKTGDFEDYGIEVYLANEKQKAEVMRKLSETLQPRVKNIYRVIPNKQKNKFNNYLAANGKPRVQMMWHGSRNENWMSIIQNSLQLNPNAVITGKMFGYGIYFAPSSLKSWNYTSINGSYWANGRSDTAFMGLYAVAYGKPFDVYSRDSSMDYKKETARRGCNCLHAHAGTMLKNDEIVFYDEAAILLNYIVEFK